MRTVSTEFNTALGQVGTTFARLWTITRTDGRVIRLTDNDSNVLVDGQIFQASFGFTSTAVLTSSTSVGSQNVELTVPLVDLGITEDDLRSRIYEEATAVLRVVNYEHPEDGTMLIFSGIVGRVVLSDKHRATIEVISFADPNVYIAGEQYSSSCRNDLGDSRCRFNIYSMAIEFEVESLIDTMAFVIDDMKGQPDDFFALGQIKWLSGENVDQVSDVRTNVLAMRSVGLFYPLPYPIAAGDTGQLLPGCDKQATTCFSKFNNIINMRAEFFAPTFGGG